MSIVPCVAFLMFTAVIDLDEEAEQNQSVLLIVAVLQIIAIIVLYILAVSFMLISSPSHVRLLNNLDSLDCDLNRIQSTKASGILTGLLIRKMQWQTFRFVVGHSIMSVFANWMLEYISYASAAGTFMFIIIDLQMMQVSNLLALMAHSAGRIRCHLDATVNGQTNASLQWKRHNVNNQIAALDKLWLSKDQFQTLFGGYLMLQFECDFIIVLAVLFVLLYFADRGVPLAAFSLLVAVHIVRVALKYYYLVMASDRYLDKVGVCI